MSVAEGLLLLPTFLIDRKAFEARDLKVLDRFEADAPASPASLRLTLITSTTIESFPVCDTAWNSSTVESERYSNRGRFSRFFGMTISSAGRWKTGAAVSGWFMMSRARSRESKSGMVEYCVLVGGEASAASK
jgi:hypothetical protein